MLHLEYNNNAHLIPLAGLTMVKLDPDKNKSTRFKWSDAIGNKIKKDVVVFKHGKVKELLQWKEAINSVMEEQKVKNPIDMIAAFNQVLGYPAKNHYNLGIIKGKTKKEKVKVIITQGGNATLNFNNAHIKGLNALGKIIPSTKPKTRSTRGSS